MTTTITVVLLLQLLTRKDFSLVEDTILGILKRSHTHTRINTNEKQCCIYNMVDLLLLLKHY